MSAMGQKATLLPLARIDVPRFLQFGVKRAGVLEQREVDALRALVGENLFGAVFDPCEHANGDFRRARFRKLLGPLHAGGHVGIDISRIYAHHERSLCAQLESYRLRQR